jgi:hypothetical protein
VCGHGKGKEEVITIHTMMALRRSGVKLHSFFNLDKRLGTAMVFQ